MPERWLYVTVRGPSGWQAELAAEALLAVGASGVEEYPTAVATYFPPPADPAAFLSVLRSVLHAAGVVAPELEWEWRPDADWAREWRRGLAARRVGERLVVTPTWIQPETRPDDVVVTIDPQMAFGTGEHATTRGVLRLLEATIQPGDRVLDVGTGSGILGIAAARLEAGHVLAVESDADALINAHENVARNGVAGRVQLLHRLVDTAFLNDCPARFDLILANVLSGVLRPLLPGFHAALRAGGRLILSGILQAEAEEMQAAAMLAGFAQDREDREEEWWTVLLRHR